MLGLATGAPWVIGVVHLAPLPGAPRYGGDLGAVRERALADAVAIETAGADAVLVENFGDAPFYPDAVPPETVAAMAVLAADVARAVRVPVGVNVLRNDARGALAVAAAAGLAFIRVNVHAGARLTDQGLVAGRAHETVRTRRALAVERVAILADVQVKHSAALAPRPLAEEARELAERALADAVLVTGPATGSPPTAEAVAEVALHCPVPVLVASGVDAQNAPALLAHAHGCIVGSAVRRDGRAGNPVDPERARRLVASIKSLPQPRPGGSR